VSLSGKQVETRYDIVDNVHSRERTRLEEALKMIVTVENFSAFDHNYSVFDEIGNVSVLTDYPMAPNDTKQITIAENGTGYGRIRFKNDQQGGWTESNLLSPGEVVQM